MTIKNKTFDCVEMKRQCQHKLQEEYKLRKDEFGSYYDFACAIAVVLPARIFDTASLLRGLHRLPEGVHYTYDKLLGEHRFTFNEDAAIRTETFSEWEFELMQRLNKCGLAR